MSLFGWITDEPKSTRPKAPVYTTYSVDLEPGLPIPTEEAYTTTLNEARQKQADMVLRLKEEGWKEVSRNKETITLEKNNPRGRPVQVRVAALMVEDIRDLCGRG